MQLRTALAVLLAWVLTAAACPAQLAGELERIADRAELGQHGIAGIAVIDALTGAVIFEHNADEPLAPASNQKLLTSAAAVRILGPQHVFTTAVHLSDDGTLILTGSGDPAMGDPKVDRTDSAGTDALFGPVPKAAADAKTVIREIVVDDRVFDRELIHPDWPGDQLDRWYCAPVQGVNVHANVFEFYTKPSAGTAAADIEPEAPWVTIESRAQAVAEGRNAIWIQRTGSDDRYILRGRIRSRAGAPVEVALHEPAMTAGRLLATRLTQAGAALDLASPARLVGRHEQLRVPAQPLATIETPIAAVLRRCNYDSMNVHAEALLKLIGATVTGEQGSWANGSAVLRMLIADTLGPDDAASTIIRDGSGLSRQNRITAGTLARWLAAMRRDQEVWAMYQDTLPSLQDKLARRLSIQPIGPRVFAKTGTINHVRCLSGYVTDPETGRTAAFAVLCNGLRTGESVRGSYRLKADIINAINAGFGEFAMPETVEHLQLGG